MEGSKNSLTMGIILAGRALSDWTRIVANDCYTAGEIEAVTKEEFVALTELLAPYGFKLV